ncbi:hypothetical protein L665_00512 [Ralstonia solanacearum SD54]|nr:hypothetical protein L665_00512 [Ralstonia solanacearum SD54]
MWHLVSVGWAGRGGAGGPSAGAMSGAACARSAPLCGTSHARKRRACAHDRPAMLLALGVQDKAPMRHAVRRCVLPRTAFRIDENAIPKPPRPADGNCAAHIARGAGAARVSGMFLVGVWPTGQPNCQRMTDIQHALPAMIMARLFHTM